MQQMRSVVRVSALVLALIFSASACTDRVSGVSQEHSPPSSEESVASIPPSEDVFSGIRACDLLDQAVRGQGFPPGTFSDLSTDNGCKAAKPGVVVGLALDDVQGIDELKADSPRRYDGDVNGRRSVQVKDTVGDGGACEVGMEVAEEARAVVGVVLGSNRPTDEACVHAGEIALAVEPALPKR
ncbi:hypothetical protein [Amycolatopsis magusensis]|uniref:hypothetical protein n=1 Tax=Amycolatopsis magusensis TaxID=882444 RepID=UPI0037B5197A